MQILGFLKIKSILLLCISGQRAHKLLTHRELYISSKKAKVMVNIRKMKCSVSSYFRSN